jgi:hypothetical protein
MISGLKARYGASPLHLIGHLVVFAIAAYALAQIFAGGVIPNFVIWFVGAALLHDLLFLPLYSLLDRVALGNLRRRWPPDAVPVVNYLRVPALLAGLLLLVYFPLVLGKATAYRRAVGHPIADYGRNWLLITAGLFAASALAYGLRVMGRSIRARPRRGL